MKRNVFKTLVDFRNSCIWNKHTEIVMDAGSPGMIFSLTPFCSKIYRLSEISCNGVTESVIMNISNFV